MLIFTRKTDGAISVFGVKFNVKSTSQVVKFTYNITIGALYQFVPGSIPGPQTYLSKVCWLSTLLRRVFSGFSVFYSLTKFDSIYFDNQIASKALGAPLCNREI